MKAEREGLLNDAKRRLSQAYADGDNDAVANATSDISRAQAELMEIQRNTPREIPENERRAAPVQQVQQPAPQVEPQVLSWIAQNSWFGKQKEKTDYALSIDRALRARGVSPASEEYTRQLDKSMKSMYPEHKPFAQASGDDEDEPRREVRRTNVTEPGGRTDENRESSRKVTLTASEIAIAKRLGVSVQAYAAQKLKAAAKGAGA